MLHVIEWREFGYSPKESEILAGVDWECSAAEEELYIEARRKEYYDEFYLYCKDNDVNPFYF